MTFGFHRPLARVFVLLCAVLLAGCGRPGASVAGTYDLDKDAIKAAVQAEAELEGDPSGAMMVGIIDAMDITLTLTADGAARMDMSMMGQVNSAAGTWTISGTTITLSLAEEGKAPRTATATIEGEAITLDFDDGGGETAFPMIFRRKPA